MNFNYYFLLYKFYFNKKKKECTEKKVDFEISFTSKDGNYSFLKEKILKDGITDVVICGGDGSLGPVIASLLNVKVNIGIIPLLSLIHISEPTRQAEISY